MFSIIFYVLNTMSTCSTLFNIVSPHIDLMSYITETINITLF